MKKYSRIRADIDLDAVLYNFENMKANIRPGCKITAVIKADGYGHGSVQIAGWNRTITCGALQSQRPMKRSG